MACASCAWHTHIVCIVCACLNVVQQRRSEGRGRRRRRSGGAIDDVVVVVIAGSSGGGGIARNVEVSPPQPTELPRVGHATEGGGQRVAASHHQPQPRVSPAGLRVGTRVGGLRVGRAVLGRCRGREMLRPVERGSYHSTGGGSKVREHTGIVGAKRCVHGNVVGGSARACVETKWSSHSMCRGDN